MRSLVGLLPLIAVETFNQERLDRLPGFKSRMEWFLKYRGDLAKRIAFMANDQDTATNRSDMLLLAMPSRERLRRVLGYLLDEDEFLSPYGIRSVSKYHEDHPYTHDLDGEKLTVKYTPGESDTRMFGGNSNWRGPVWFPINYLLLEALQRYHHFYGETFTVECPVGSGNMMTLDKVAKRDRTTPDQALRPRRRGPGVVLRILPRRHRPRPRRFAPNRVDRAGGAVYRGHGLVRARGNLSLLLPVSSFAFLNSHLPPCTVLIFINMPCSNRVRPPRY